MNVVVLRKQLVQPGIQQLTSVIPNKKWRYHKEMIEYKKIVQHNKPEPKHNTSQYH